MGNKDMTFQILNSQGKLSLDKAEPDNHLSQVLKLLFDWTSSYKVIHINFFFVKGENTMLTSHSHSAHCPALSRVLTTYGAGTYRTTGLILDPSDGI